MDYEGELCVIIGKNCKDVSDQEDPMKYVFGLTCGNDVSARFWQMPERSGQQHGYAKSFDGFAPMGPLLVSPSAVPDLAQLKLMTRVNGEIRQQTDIGDLLFDVGALVRHLSRGTTLRPGTVIMTGTPNGVAAFMRPPQWLHNGDQVEVEISGLGKIKNTFRCP
jgi:2-keto-4-pentenoate hydratase/2-oxohepta-3-ene-1,7-dioic acid hydratase in catechol pathway